MVETNIDYWWETELFVHPASQSNLLPTQIYLDDNGMKHNHIGEAGTTEFW